MTSKPPSKFFTALVVIAAGMLLGGCAGSPTWNSEQPYPPAIAPEVGDVLHLATGHYVSKKQMLENIAITPLVYVGEVHDNPASHRLQLEVLQSMLRQHPGQVALGMEMFTSRDQGALDRWVAGEMGEKEFLRASGWYINGWKLDFAYYRQLLEFCRDNNIPVIGLNTDNKLQRRTDSAPQTDMEPEISEQLPEMDMTDPYQQAMVSAIYRGHDKGGSKIGKFLRQQVLWDEAMAESVANYLEIHTGSYMVVVAGGWHIRYGLGIPRRVFRRLPLPYIIIGGENLSIPPEKQHQIMDVTIPEFPMRPADYLVYQDYEVLEKKGVRLGVLLGDRDEIRGVLITDVVPESAAELAGISEGERLISFDGESVSDYFDVIYAVKGKSPGDKARLVVRGSDGERVVDIAFP